MTLTKKDVLNIERKLEAYDRIFVQILKRFDMLDKRLKKKEVKKGEKWSDNEKIYLSISGLSRVSSTDD